MAIQRRFLVWSLALLMVLYFSCLGLCRGEIQKLSPAKDTYIDEHNPSTINGSNPYLVLRCIWLSGGWVLEALTQFDLGSIAAGTNIHSAHLNMYYSHYYDGNPVGHPLEVHRVTQDWPEDTTCWNNQPTFDSTATTTAVAPAAAGWVQWDVTSDVQAFVDGAKTNYGWILQDVYYFGNPMVYFYSREWADPALRPYLQIDLDTEPCGGNGYHPGDFNHDCRVDLGDLLMLAKNWLTCSDPSDSSCTIPAQNKIVGAGFAFDGDSTGPAKVLFLYDNMNEGQLQPDDEIQEYNGAPVSSGTQFKDMLKVMPNPLPGTSVPMTVLRNGITNNITVQVNYIRRVDFRQYLHPYRYTKHANSECHTEYLSNGKHYCYCKDATSDKVCYDKNLYYQDPDSENVYEVISECFDVYTAGNTLDLCCYSFNPDDAPILPGHILGLTSIIGK
jgi:hypothetical protein